jgi:hypothetical protein
MLSRNPVARHDDGARSETGDGLIAERGWPAGTRQCPRQTTPSCIHDDADFDFAARHLADLIAQRVVAVDRLAPVVL